MYSEGVLLRSSSWLSELGPTVVAFEVLADGDGEGSLVGMVVVAEGEQLDGALAVAEVPRALAERLLEPAVGRFHGAGRVRLVWDAGGRLVADAWPVLGEPCRRGWQRAVGLVLGVDGRHEGVPRQHGVQRAVGLAQQWVAVGQRREDVG
jgi:hypothetical protein